MGHQLVEGERRQIEVEVAGENRHPALERHEAVVKILLLARLISRRAEDRLDTVEDLARLRLAPFVDSAALDVVVVRLGARDVRLDREDRIRVARRERPPLRRRAGLQDRRPVLRRAHDVQGTARLEEGSRVLDAMDLRGIREDAGLAIHHQGVRFPAVPQLAADFHELVRAVVALVGGFSFFAVVRRLVVVQRGHHVPGRAPARQVIERGPQARGIERMLVADRERRAEPDARRHRGHERQQGNRIVLGRLRRVADGGVHRPGRRRTPCRTCRARRRVRCADRARAAPSRSRPPPCADAATSPGCDRSARARGTGRGGSFASARGPIGAASVAVPEILGMRDVADPVDLGGDDPEVHDDAVA